MLTRRLTETSYKLSNRPERRAYQLPPESRLRFSAGLRDQPKSGRRLRLRAKNSGAIIFAPNLFEQIEWGRGDLAFPWTNRIGVRRSRRTLIPQLFWIASAAKRIAEANQRLRPILRAQYGSRFFRPCFFRSGHGLRVLLLRFPQRLAMRSEEKGQGIWPPAAFAQVIVIKSHNAPDGSESLSPSRIHR